MLAVAGRVTEIQIGPGGRLARIACPAKAVPAPGQYLLAVDADGILPTVLFTAQSEQAGFLAAPPTPVAWEPGTPLALYGPQGRGFRLPAGVRRLALIALGETVARLEPLIAQAIAQEMAVALFTDALLPNLPMSLEAHPLSALPESLPWADFLALDLPLETLPGLDSILGLAPGSVLPCQGQAMIQAAMPCGGLAECGVCAVPTRRGWKLACKDGPVFDVKDLSISKLKHGV
jgi:dihydroorotate dehydrogenase electron transfer subunit